MKPTRILFNNKGLSLIEATVSAGLLVVIIGVMSSLQVGQAKSSRQIKHMQAKLSYVDDIKENLGNYSSCSEVMKEILFDIGKSNLNDNIDVVDKKLSATLVKELNDGHWSDGLIQTKEVHFNLNKIPDPDAKDYEIYEGKLTVTYEIKNKQAHEDGTNSIEIPVDVIRRKSPEATAKVDTKYISCVNPQSSLSAQLSEICDFYGGVLSNGMTCDYNRVMREHYENASDSSVPIPDITNDTQVKRISFADVLCYLDQLVVRIPNQQQADPKRSPVQDYFEQNQATSFCKRPGVVDKATSVNIAKLNDRTSPDVVDIFTEEASVIPTDTEIKVICGQGLVKPISKHKHVTCKADIPLTGAVKWSLYDDYSKPNAVVGDINSPSKYSTCLIKKNFYEYKGVKTSKDKKTKKINKRWVEIEVGHNCGSVTLITIGKK